jgi:hypothetical protein
MKKKENEFTLSKIAHEIYQFEFMLENVGNDLKAACQNDNLAQVAFDVGKTAYFIGNIRMRILEYRMELESEATK